MNYMLWILIILLIAFAVREGIHRKTAYYQITHVPYFRVRRNLGRYGEYLTYRYLREYEKEGAKFLFNLYIPKGENGTTEIDVLMISSNGLFIFESKNYSGWIFGSEHQPKWYQTLPQGRGRSHKESFYNPIMQNRTHIRHLKALVGEAIPMHSIITFSNRCTLKNVQISSSDIHVINRGEVMDVVASICSNACAALSEEQIQGFYDLLYPYTQADTTVREKHIEDIEQMVHCETDKLSAMPISVQTTEEISSEQIVVQPEQEATPLQCPRCGGALVLRTAKKGSNAGNRFYGCSNFPKCRYIRNI